MRDGFPDPTREAAPLPFPPVAWKADGSLLLYAALDQGAQGSTSGFSGWLAGSSTKKAGPALYALAPAGPVRAERLLAQSQAPVWRGDDTLAALARPDNKGPVQLAVTDLAGHTLATAPLAELPARPLAAYAARWDTSRANAIVTVRDSGASLTAGSAAGPAAIFFLVRFRPEDADAAVPHAVQETAR